MYHILAAKKRSSQSITATNINAIDQTHQSLCQLARLYRELDETDVMMSKFDVICD